MRIRVLSWSALWVVLAIAFALRALLLIDATGLWSDELYSVGKSFQPDLSALIGMLREDTHPPLYYVLLWGWGGWLGGSPLTLRLFSWLAYLAGGAVMLAQIVGLAREEGRDPWRCLPIGLLGAFCSPYPIRFAIEGKSYALLVLLVALAWWWRRQQRAVPYGLALALASLTHFYGLFLALAAASWDGWTRRWRLAGAAAVAAAPALAWIAYAATYLFSDRAGSWIGTPDFALLEDTLARGLGLWPLPKLAVGLALIWVLRRHGWRWGNRELLDRSAVIPSALMVVGVVAVSFIKPLAFSRYFVVLLPAVLPWLAVQAGAVSLTPRLRWVVAGLVAALLLTWWGPGFRELDPVAPALREQDQFALVSRRTAGLHDRYSPRSRLLNLSDRMEQAMGRIPTPVAAWGNDDALKARLEGDTEAAEIWLASSGPDPALTRKLKPMRRLVEEKGFRCEESAEALSHGRILRCRSAARGPG